ncbi:hypothetical protein [Acinetobacter baumannii]|uniref:hypothetical protein n=1 Tax=Acinetobacter baumannii TaxID=470 RepID=UPI003A8587C6
MDKCREEFEEYFKEHHADSFYSVDVALEMRGDDYIDFLASDLWAIWQHQQTKVEELQKRVEWLEDRLKATDTLSKMRAAVIGSFKTQEFNARTRRKMMILKRAEQALKGDQYDEHRKKAEEAISKGASLTNHRIEL